MLPSLATTALVMVLNGVTVMILVVAADRHQAFDLGTLLGHLPSGWGPIVQALTNTITWASVYLCLVGYIVVIADSLEPFALHAAGGLAKDSPVAWLRVRVPLVGASGALVLPLCFLDQRRLAFSSTLGIFVNVYLLALVALLFAQMGVAPGCCLAGVSKGAMTMFSCLMQSAIMQMCVLPMYEELEDRSPRRFGAALAVGFAFLTVLFVGFSSAAYFAFGPQVRANVIENLPEDMLGTFARLGMAVVILAVFPFYIASMTAPVRHWEEARATKGSGHGRVTTAATVAIVFLSSVGAAFASHLGVLNTINGALQVGGFIALVPGITGLFLLGESCSSRWWSLGMAALIAGGLVLSLLGFFYTSNAVNELSASCFWTT